MHAFTVVFINSRTRNIHCVSSKQSSLLTAAAAVSFAVLTHVFVLPFCFFFVLQDFNCHIIFLVTHPQSSRSNFFFLKSDGNPLPLFFLLSHSFSHTHSLFLALFLFFSLFLSLSFPLSLSLSLTLCVCVCVCVCARARVRARMRVPVSLSLPSFTPFLSLFLSLAPLSHSHSPCSVGDKN